MKFLKNLLAKFLPQPAPRPVPTLGTSNIGMDGQPIDFEVLNQLRDEAFAVAKSVGFHTSGEVNIPAQIANLHAELSELFEAYRRQYLDSPCDKADKMLEPLTAGEEEIADVVIRAFDFAADLKIDLARAVRIKNAFNKTRPHRNGGKLV